MPAQRKKSVSIDPEAKNNSPPTGSASPRPATGTPTAPEPPRQGLPPQGAANACMQGRRITKDERTKRVGLISDDPEYGQRVGPSPDPLAVSKHMAQNLLSLGKLSAVSGVYDASLPLTRVGIIRPALS